MARLPERRALARASAYLILDHRKATVQLVHGAQVDYALSEIYEDHEVTPLQGGAYMVRPTPRRPLGVGAKPPMLQYIPLHEQQDLHHHVSDAAVYDTRLSLEGLTFRTMPRTGGKDLRKFIYGHEGRFYRTADDCILRIHRVGRGPWRLLGMWKPVEAPDMAQAA